MKQKFDDIQSSAFPDIESRKFDEWKNAGLSYRKKYRLYFYLIMGPLAAILMIAFVQSGFAWGVITTGLLWGGAGGLSILIARALAGNEYANLSKELGITDKVVRKVLSGEKIEEKPEGGETPPRGLLDDKDINLSMTETILEHEDKTYSVLGKRFDERFHAEEYVWHHKQRKGN